MTSDKYPSGNLKPAQLSEEWGSTNDAASAGAFSIFPGPRGGHLVQSAYAESIAGYSGFTHESDHLPLLGLKSRPVQKGRMDGQVHALHPWTTKQPQRGLGTGAG